ncbi:MAG: histidinol-phosphate transaminase [Spirochaetaceae bacterium]|nr:MAG: histidinol-phosphate transaminase [Spirochaetaceae bacterium]
MKDIEKRINRGLLEIKPYEPGKTVYEVAQERGISDIIKLASNENPYGMSGAAKKALGEHAAEGFAYPEVTTARFRNELAKQTGLDPDMIITGNGGDGIIYALAMTLLNEGDEAIIPEITFPYYEIAVKAMRGTIVRSAMKDLAIDTDDILAKITHGTKMIWLANPNNPTGLYITGSAFMEFLRKVPDNVFVIHDEVYADFAGKSVFPDTIPLLMKGRENLFIIRSFSKVYGLAGVRLGWGAGDKDLVKMMYRVRPPFDVSVLAEIAGLAALTDRDFYSRTIALTNEEKMYYYKELEKRKLKFLPSQTNFVLIDANIDSRRLADELAGKGVIVRPCAGYGLATYIRVTVGTRNQNERFFRALDEVKGK